jgi:2-dehydro-3-deoxygluconokinase
MMITTTTPGSYFSIAGQKERASMSSDIVSFGETMLRLTAPSDNRLETTPLLHVYVGGSESNTLASLARLNFHTRWLSALPATPLGKHVETELRRHGIDTSAVVWSANNTRLGTFYAEEAPPPLGIQVYYDRANSACALIDPDAVDYSILDTTRVLHLTGITPALGAGAREVFERLLAHAHTRDLPLSFDVNYRAKLWSAHEAASQIEAACSQAHVLFCARADAAELWNFRGSPEEILRQMASRFQEEHIPKTLVLTLGAEGSAHLHNGEYAYAPALPTEGTSRFGSGDAFSAGYLYAFFNGPLYQEMHQAHNTSPLTFGNALAALKRCIVGDIAVITPDDIRALLQKQEGKRFR